jgi:hypothetical protein
VRATLIAFASFWAASSSVASPPPAQKPEVASLCELAKHNADLDGRRVRVRARLVISEHATTLKDEHCPKVSLFLRRTEGGPDASLCAHPDLSERFGCPADSKRYIVATFSGLYVVPEVGAPRLYLEAMEDFEERGEAGAKP